MNDSLQFAQPAWLWIGFAICVALVFATMNWNRRRERDLEKLAHARLLSRLTESVSKRRRRIKQGLWLLTLMLVFVAMARPQYGFEFREVKRRGIDLVFAVDTSRSMLAEDVAPNRLERSRLAITDFIDRLEGDRIGLIPFAGNAFSLCPLTLDYGAFRQSLDALNTGLIPHQGTDLASAVREANRLFDEEGNNHRILILITDGEDLQGAVMDAVDTAKEKGMTIHAVGVGSPEGVLIPITREDGSQDFVRDDTGQPVKSALDESTLQTIAQATGGIYAPLGRAGQGLETIYREKLRLVPKSEMDQRLERIPLERYEWPLAAAILLLMLEFLIGERRRSRAKELPVISAARRVFRNPAPRKAKSEAVAAAVILALTGASASAEESSTPVEGPEDPRQQYNLGTEAYRAGEYERAETSLDRGLAETTDLNLQQRAYYNLGNTRFRLGQQTLAENPEATIGRWEASVKAFEDALALNPDDGDAAFNRDFVKKKLEELKQQQQQQQQQEQEQEESKQQGESEEENPSDQQENNGDQENPDESETEPNPDNSQSESKEAQEDTSEDRSESQETEASENEAEGEQKKEEENSESGAKDQPAEKRDGEPEQSLPKNPQSGEEPADPREQETDPRAGKTEFSEERRAPDEMSTEEAAQLLEALENDERSVIPLPDVRTYRQAVPNNTTRGKTW